MEPISVILAVILLGSCEGKPQLVDPLSSGAADPNSLVSPWSQWMSLKAPPIPGLPMGGSKAKKKLIPGPPPPEGTAEAPWVTWTRMKVSSALSPLPPSAPAPPQSPLGLPPSPPPPPTDNSNNSAPSSSAEPTVWIQWTQMKVPLTNPSTPSGSSVETPWDAWTKLKLSQVAPPVPPPSSSPELVRRMAPDRYNIASTMAPRLSKWPPSPVRQTSQSPSIPQMGQISSPRPSYLDVLNVTPSMYIPRLPVSTSPSQASQLGINLGSSQVPPITISPESLPEALKPIPHQLVSQIVAKATPEELTQIILAMSKAEDEQQQTASTTVSVKELLPPSLVAKLPDDLTPLLATSVKVPTVTTAEASLMSVSKNAELFSMIPEPTRTAILSKGTPQELNALLSTITKLEALPPSEQAPIASLSVESILPPSLQAKLPPPTAAANLIPPVLLNLPAPLINAVLPVATPSELEVLVANAARVEKSPLIVPGPPLGALLPPSLVAKVPSQFAPILAKPVPQPAQHTVPPTSVLTSVPPQLVEEILPLASSSEVQTVADAVSVLEAAIGLLGTAAPLPAAAVIPQTLISKLPPQALPLLTLPLTPGPAPQTDLLTPVLATLSPPVVQQVVTFAVPEELAEIKENIVAKAATTTPILPLLPVSLVNKLPPQILLALSTIVTIPPAPSSPEMPQKPAPYAIIPPGIPDVPLPVESTVIVALSKLPPSAIAKILTVAAPDEINEVADIIAKLEAVAPSEKPLISQVGVDTILPATLLAKLPPTMLSLLTTTPIDLEDVVPTEKIPLPSPDIPGVPPSLVATVTPALSKVPPPVAKVILTIATPNELIQLADTVTKLEALSPDEKAKLPALQVETILPSSLVAKLPKSVIPLLDVPVVITAAVTSPAAMPTTIPAEPAVPPKTLLNIVPTLSAVPPPVLAEILTLATPTEVEEVAEIIAKIEALPPSEASLVAKLDVSSILPPSLVAKLPPSILSQLSVPVTVPPPSPTPPVAIPTTIPAAPAVPPKALLNIVPALSAVPPPVLAEILTLATPTEVEEVAEIIAKIEALPPSEASLVAKLDVSSILPPSLVAKLPPSVLPQLSVPITVPPPSPTPPVIISPPPVGVPTKAIADLKVALSAVPPSVVAEIMSVATPTELETVAEIISKLEALLPAETPIVDKLDVETILPATLVAKLPPSVLPLLDVPITIPRTVPPIDIPLVVSEVPPSVISTVKPALSEIPSSVLSEILSVATPAELTDLAETITKLNALPPAQIPLVASLEVETVLPPTLLAKLEPSVLHYLAKPITLAADVPPATSAEPASDVVIPGIPPSIASVAVPPLSSLPPPVIEKVLKTASPSELAQLVDTIMNLEALPPAEKELAAALEVETILPPSLVKKMPAAVVPLLSTPVRLSGLSTTSTAAPAIVPTPPPRLLEPPAPEVPQLIQSTILPALSALPYPVIASILTAASPTEIAQISEAITKLEALPLQEPPVLPTLPVKAVLPPQLLARLPPSLAPVLSDTNLIAAAATTPSPIAPALDSTEPILPAEDKVLTKWAKVILEKAGKPTTVFTPEKIPPLQAAWMEWIQLKLNTSKTPVDAPFISAPVGEQSTTEYPWTQWLKLKTNSSSIPPVAPAPSSTPIVEVITQGPEKVVVDWLQELGKGTEAPVTPATLTVSPETEAMVAEALKDLGIEMVDLPPEQVKAILEQVEKSTVPVQIPKELAPLPGPVPTFQPYPAFLPYIPPKPFYPLWYPPPAFPPPAPYSSLPTSSVTSPPVSSPESPSPPTLNLTEYLIVNSLIPPEISPSASIPIPTLSKLITEQAATSPEASTPESTITADELSSLTPTKFAALLKQILHDCRLNSTASSNSSSLATRSLYPNSYATYYKNKYAPSWRARRSPALYPIPSQAFTPTSTLSPLDTSSIPLPKVDTSGTVLDPAYWAAQKSMFLSKLFSTLAKVALNDTNNQAAVTPSPKEQLAKQVNAVLLSDMTRSVHHHPPKKQQPIQEEEEDSPEVEEEYEQEEDDIEPPANQGGSHDLNQNEKELVSNDNSEPNLPKEPENPLHKLFKFGVQKTVLSDLSTPAPAPIYIYVTPPPYHPEIITSPPLPPSSLKERIKNVYQKKKSKGKKKKRPSSSSSHQSTHNRHHGNTNSKISHSSRFRPSSVSTVPTTTESPVDFELLAKALLLDDTTGNGPKAAGRRK